MFESSPWDGRRGLSLWSIPSHRCWCPLENFLCRSRCENMFQATQSLHCAATFYKLWQAKRLATQLAKGLSFVQGLLFNCSEVKGHKKICWLNPCMTNLLLQKKPRYMFKRERKSPVPHELCFRFRITGCNQKCGLCLTKVYLDLTMLFGVRSYGVRTFLAWC